MQFSNCVKIEGVMYLKADFSVLCYDEKWWSFYVVFLIVGVVYILGLPLGVFFYLYSRRNRLDRPEILHSVGWMYTPYNRNAYFWESKGPQGGPKGFPGGQKGPKGVPKGSKETFK